MCFPLSLDTFLFLSSLVGLWNKIPTGKENPGKLEKNSNFDFQAWKSDFKGEYNFFF